MPPKTAAQKTGIPETQDEAARKEAEAAGQQLTWEQWLAGCEKHVGKKASPEQRDLLFEKFHAGNGLLISAVSVLDNDDEDDGEVDATYRHTDVLPGIRVNEHDVVTAGFRTLKLDIPTTTKVTAVLKIAQVRTGQWGAGFDLNAKTSGASAPIMVDGAKHTSEEAVVDWLITYFLNWLQAEHERDPKLKLDVRRVRAAAEIHRERLIGGWLHRQLANSIDQKRAAATQASGPPAPPQPSAIADAVFENVEAPLHLVDDNPDNTRQNFDDASLAETAESMMLVGQIQACLARRKGERYQLIDGGRRKRAAAIAGRATLRLDLVPDSIDDATALEMMGRANEERKEFDPISRALWFEKLLAVRGCTQEELGERLRVSQSVISNHLRLLALPDAWRKRLIAREISETHGRSLVPWADTPALLEILDQELSKEEEIPSARDWPGWVRQTIEEATLPCRPGGYLWGSGASTYYGPCLMTEEVVEANREALQLIELRDGSGKSTEVRALNAKLWNKLHKKLEKEAETAREQQLQAVTKRNADKSSTKREAPSEGQIEGHIERWTRDTIAERLEAETRFDTFLPFIALYWIGSEDAPAPFDNVCQTFGIKPGSLSYDEQQSKFWAVLEKAPLDKVKAGLRKAVIESFKTSWDPLGCEKTIAAIAKLLDVVYTRDFIPSEAMLLQYDVATLRELPAAARAKISPQAGKEKVAAALLKAWIPGEFPPGYEPKAPEPPKAPAKKGGKR